MGGETELYVKLNNNINATNFSPGSITITASIQSMPWDSARITIPVTASIEGNNRKLW